MSDPVMTLIKLIDPIAMDVRNRVALVACPRKCTIYSCCMLTRLDFVAGTSSRTIVPLSNTIMRLPLEAHTYTNQIFIHCATNYRATLSISVFAIMEQTLRSC